MTKTIAQQVLLRDRNGNILIPVVDSDKTVTANSNKPVTSGAVFDLKESILEYLNSKLAGADGELPEAVTLLSGLRYAYYAGDGKAQTLDLAGNLPREVGSPVAIDALLFETGKPEPDYGASSRDSYLLCREVYGNLDEFEVTNGAAQAWCEIDGNYDYHLVSLRGVYRIKESTAIGEARQWVCEQTTPYGSAAGAKVIVFCECPGEEYSNWHFSPTDMYETFAYASVQGAKSVLEVPSWKVNGNLAENLTFAQTAADDPAPYGPKFWAGERIVWTNEPVLASSGAGVKNCNGFWKKVDAPDLVTGYTYENCNGKARLDLNSNGVPEYGWRLMGSDPLLYPDGKFYQMYDVDYYHGWWRDGEEPVDPWDAVWHSGSSSFGSAVKFFYSETGGYMPNGEIVRSLPITGAFPEVGRIYNADASVCAASMYPA